MQELIADANSNVAIVSNIQQILGANTGLTLLLQHLAQALARPFTTHANILPL
jgi:hypothetical protein